MSKLDKSYELHIDSFTFFVNVTGYYHQPALGPSADNDVDCYGYTEIDWECNQVLDCDEDGNETEVTVDIAEYSELIEEKVLEIMKDEAESQDYDDFDDGYDGY